MIAIYYYVFASMPLVVVSQVFQPSSATVLSSKIVVLAAIQIISTRKHNEWV